MHPNGGNLLFTDGSVEHVDGDGLGKVIDRYRSVPYVNRITLPDFKFPRNPSTYANEN